VTNAPAGGRRVLVVAYDFPPHAAIGTMRTLRVVRELHARGWEVAVVTGDPAGYLPGTPVDPALLDAVPQGVRVWRAAPLRPWARLQGVLKAPFRGTRRSPPTGAAQTARPPQRRGVLAALAGVKDIVDALTAIPDNESGWVLPAIRRGAFDEARAWRPDVIYSSAPPWTGQLVAAALQRLLRRPWVADFRDPWARAPWRGDRYWFARRAAAWLERRVIRRADRVVFVAAANRDDFAAVYGSACAAKFDVVPNGCDPSEFEAIGQVDEPQGPFVLLHAGSLYAGRTPVPLFRAIAQALAEGRIDRAGFRLRFLGQNAMPGADLPGTCRQLGIDDVVEFLPRVPREQGLRAMMSASSLLLLQPGHAVSVPGKLYEYMASGRPIFAIADEGETAELVRRTPAGTSVTAGDEGVIADALVAAISRRRQPILRTPRELYDGRIGAARIVDILGAVRTKR